MGIDSLKYKNNLMYMEGYIVSVQDAGVEIDLKGRLGMMKIPMRMLISDYPLKVGQTIGFMMSHPEVLSDEIDETYRKTINKEGRI